jgi:hypothetical protein
VAVGEDVCFDRDHFAWRSFDGKPSFELRREMLDDDAPKTFIG